MASSQAKMPSSGHQKYTIIRESSSLERMWYLYHRLGIQSNVIVSADYTHATNGVRLSKPAVLEALRAVVEANGALRQVGVAAPSRRKGRHTLHIAMLHEIGLEACVEFIEDEISSVTAEHIERAHNQWYFDEPDGPWFKLWVINGRTVFFIFHHLLADGRSGYFFHQQFLANLNNSASKNSATPSAVSWIVRAQPSASEAPMDCCDMVRQGAKLGKPWKPSPVEALWPVFVTWLLRLLFAGRFVFANLPPTKPYLKSATAVAELSERTESRISLSRIPSKDVEKILVACRANKTTFTPLLSTMLMITLITDYYPKASFGGLRIACDLRPLCPEPLATEERYRMANRAGVVVETGRIGKYKKVIRKFTSPTSDAKEEAELDTQGVWNLSRSCRTLLHTSIDGNARVQSHIRDMSPELEDYVTNVMPMIDISSSHTILVSNLGVFTPREETSKGTDLWQVSDVVFSAAPTNGNQGSRGLIFSIAGLAQGDVAIVAGFEEGVISREMAQNVLDATIRRMLRLVTSDSAKGAERKSEAEEKIMKLV